MKKARAFRRSMLVATASLTLVVPALADMRMWVVINDLKRHTCPSSKCGVVGRFFFQESVFVYERKNGWSRVSDSKSAGCYDGKSIYVESGRSDCTRENGIIQGKFSEWVQSDYLADRKSDAPQDLQG